MTIRDLASRLGVTHQAVRARIQKETGKSSKELTSDGNLTPEGLQLVADLYYDGDLAALEAAEPLPAPGDDRAADLARENELLNQTIALLTQERDRLSAEVVRLTQEANNLASRNAQLSDALLREVSRAGELTQTIADQAASIARIADQAQQLQLASLSQQKKPFLLRLFGK